jgi:hypothetical protein
VTRANRIDQLMDWPQVTDDFIKIGLPVICTSAVALLVSKFTRSHDLDKERRQRRQDALEKISEDFQLACVSLSELAINYSVYRESQNDPARPIAFGELLKSGAAMDAATKDLHRIRGRLKLLRLEKCEEAFVEFLNQTIEFRKMLKLPPEPMATKDMVQKKVDELKLLQDAVERSLTEAFASV